LLRIQSHAVLIYLWRINLLYRLSKDRNNQQLQNTLEKLNCLITDHYIIWCQWWCILINAYLSRNVFRYYSSAQLLYLLTVDIKLYTYYLVHENYNRKNVPRCAIMALAARHFIRGGATKRIFKVSPRYKISFNINNIFVVYERGGEIWQWVFRGNVIIMMRSRDFTVHHNNMHYLSTRRIRS